MLLNLVLLPLLLALPPGNGPRAGREYAFDIWDWTPPGRDLATFRTWAADLRSIGVTRIEMSAPWRLLEPRPGEYDLSFITDRLAAAKAHGMGLRIRINSYYAGATPGWLGCDRWLDAQGQIVLGGLPSINDPRFWARYGPLCTAIAKRFRGEDILYSPFIGVHAELKWSEWWTYDPSSLAVWRKAIQKPRPAWLRRIVGDVPLPERPPVPGPTAGTPDTSAESRAFIAFREACWREAVRRFVQAIRAGDPRAKVSVPLGESYRRQSAEMSNLDYRGLSRGASQVVHSYDFFWHAGQDPWYAGAAVTAFRGITGLPVSFEFDGYSLIEQHGYTEADLLRIADAALSAGAAMKVANYSYSDRLPSSWPFLVEVGRRVAGRKAQVESPESLTHRRKGAEGEKDSGTGAKISDLRLAPVASPPSSVLLFVSKWANYCYREPTEWLHDAQFGAWKMLIGHGYPVRFICEDNLTEDLRGYRGVYVAFSPPDLMPVEDRRRLERLCAALPSVVELSATPAWTAPGWSGEPRPHRAGKQVTLDYPLAYRWLHGTDRTAEERWVQEALRTFQTARSEE